MTHEDGAFVRVIFFTALFPIVEKIARRCGGWPTNSPWECRNGLLSTSGFFFPDSMPMTFIDSVIALGGRMLEK